ncbi:hypothetical protein [Streptomyces sp. P9-A2]
MTGSDGPVVGRTMISLTSTSAGWSMANEMAAPMDEAGTATLW